MNFESCITNPNKGDLLDRESLLKNNKDFLYHGYLGCLVCPKVIKLLFFWGAVSIEGLDWGKTTTEIVGRQHQFF